MSNMGNSGSKLEKNIVIFEINSLESVELQTLVQKIKILKFETKNALFMYF